MRAVYAVVLVAAVVGVPLLVRYVGAMRRRPVATPLDHTAQFRNHQAMARWIDRQLNDEMASASIPPEQRHAARELLAEFYGDDPRRELR